MSISYYYGTSYNYDNAAKSFTLTGTVTTGEIKTGQYTCAQTSADATCTTLYYVDTLSSGTSYYVLPLNSNSHYSQFGELQFNYRYTSLADVGYMYNTRYNNLKNDSISIEVMLVVPLSTSTSWWYADTVTISENKYNLNSPYRVSSTTDYTNLVGKYTFRSSTETYVASYVYYIAAVILYSVDFRK